MKSLTRIVFKGLLLAGFCFGAGAPGTALAQSAENLKALSYMGYLSTRIVGRPLNSSEISALKSSGSAAFGQIASAWSREPNFAENMQIYVETLLGTSGVSGIGDFGLPGYLAKEIAAKGKPYSELLTANYCVNGSGQTIPCDTQAPFNAGVLTTKAFLSTYGGAYNISRAAKMMDRFLCSDYPFSEAEEPRLTEQELIAQFSTRNGTITFGNGNDCYTCHSQFGWHSQFFVKFDGNGVYKAAATGLQNPSTSVTDGFSTDNTYTSHLKDPNRAKSENSRILGKPAKNLAEAAVILTQSPKFLSCAAKNMSKHFLRLSGNTLNGIHPALYEQIATQAKALSPEPGFGDLLQAIITNPHVFNSFKKSGATP